MSIEKYHPLQALHRVAPSLFLDSRVVFAQVHLLSNPPPCLTGLGILPGSSSSSKTGDRRMRGLLPPSIGQSFSNSGAITELAEGKLEGFYRWGRILSKGNQIRFFPVCCGTAEKGRQAGENFLLCCAWREVKEEKGYMVLL